MLAYDLTNTALATTQSRPAVPTEGELLAVLVALLLLHDRSLSEMYASTVELHETDCHRVADVLVARVPPLAREFGQRETLMLRLRQLAGLRITNA